MMDAIVAPGARSGAISAAAQPHTWPIFWGATALRLVPPSGTFPSRGPRHLRYFGSRYITLPNLRLVPQPDKIGTATRLLTQTDH